MEEDLSDFLNEKYPHILQGFKYFEIGPGWNSLIKDMFKELHEIKQDCYPKINTIKEKFGGLRVYFDDAVNSPIENIIDKYETLSFTTCIRCSSIDEVKLVGKWIEPLCAKCRNPDTNT